MNISVQRFAWQRSGTTRRSYGNPKYKSYTDLRQRDWGLGWELRSPARTLKLHRMFARLINAARGVCCTRVKPQKEMALGGHSAGVIFSTSCSIAATEEADPAPTRQRPAPLAFLFFYVYVKCQILRPDTAIHTCSYHVLSKALDTKTFDATHQDWDRLSRVDWKKSVSPPLCFFLNDHLSGWLSLFTSASEH